MATSTAQTIPLVELYDYYLAPGDPSTSATSKGKSGRTVKVTLQYDRALTIAPDAVVWAAQEAVYSALTDANGFWHVFLIPNNKISPANTYYTVEIEGGLSYQVQVTDVGVPAPGWQSSAPGILLNIPSALAPTTSTVGAITATGLITAQAGLNVTAGGVTIGAGGESIVGGLTVDTITYSQAVSRLIPGGTSFSVRDTGNANDNLLVTNAGNATVRGSLTVTGGPFTLSAGNVVITNGSLTISGASMGINFAGTTGFAFMIGGASGLQILNNAGAQNNLVIADAGTVTVNRGPFVVSAGGATITAGNLTITAGNLLMGAGATLLTLHNQQTTAQTLNFPNIREAETVAVQPQVTTSSPANPTGTANTTGLMMGLAGAITPQVTGRIFVTIAGDMTSSITSDGGKVQIRWGTGGAPANGAALTGTAVGPIRQCIIPAAAGNGQASWSVQWIITGLTLGTAIWLDLSLAAVGGGTATLLNVSITANEL